MMRSMFAGISGLRSHQTRMDVIGNNIANVNTVGYKKSRVTFQDMLNQTMRGAAGPQGDRGGTNPMQIGLGVKLGSIDVIHEGSAPQSTGRSMDLSIEGEGFFVVGQGQELYYTRAGNFDIDPSYNLTTVNGLKVKGWVANNDFVLDTTRDMTDINLSALGDKQIQKATSEIYFGKNLDSRTVGGSKTKGDITISVAEYNDTDGPIVINLGESFVLDNEFKIGDEYSEDDWDFDPVKGTLTLKETAEKNKYFTGPIDDEYTLKEITYHKAETSPDITIFDSQGNAHKLKIIFAKTAENEWQGKIEINDEPIDNGLFKIKFDEEGQVIKGAESLDANGRINITHKLGNGVNDINTFIDLSTLSQVANETTATGLEQNGFEPGSLKSMSVNTAGTIVGTFSNGVSLDLAQVAVANFRNPAGLEKHGNSLFRESKNSGIAQIGTPGSAGRGTITPETLEMSNVDLSQEFVDMITTQRGFQANSRIITTSDEMLQELVNLKR